MSSIPFTAVKKDQNYYGERLKGCVVRLSEQVERYTVRYAANRAKIDFYGTGTAADYYVVMTFRDRTTMWKSRLDTAQQLLSTAIADLNRWNKLVANGVSSTKDAADLIRNCELPERTSHDSSIVASDKTKKRKLQDDSSVVINDEGNIHLPQFNCRG